MHDNCFGICYAQKWDQGQRLHFNAITALTELLLLTPNAYRVARLPYQQGGSYFGVRDIGEIGFRDRV